MNEDTRNETITESAATDHFPEGAVSRDHFPGMKQGPPNVPSDILQKWVEWLRTNGTQGGEAECWYRFEQEQKRKAIRKQQLQKRKRKNRARGKMQKASRKANR